MKLKNGRKENNHRSQNSIVSKVVKLVNNFGKGEKHDTKNFGNNYCS